MAVCSDVDDLDAFCFQISFDLIFHLDRDMVISDRKLH